MPGDRGSGVQTIRTESRQDVEVHECLVIVHQFGDEEVPKIVVSRMPREVKRTLRTGHRNVHARLGCISNLGLDRDVLRSGVSDGLSTAVMRQTLLARIDRIAAAAPGSIVSLF